MKIGIIFIKFLENNVKNFENIQKEFWYNLMKFHENYIKIWENLQNKISQNLKKRLKQQSGLTPSMLESTEERRWFWSNRRLR